MVNKKLIVSDIIFNLTSSNKSGVTVWLFMVNGCKNFIKDVYHAEYWDYGDIITIKCGAGTSLNYRVEEIKDYSVM